MEPFGFAAEDSGSVQALQCLQCSSLLRPEALKGRTAQRPSLKAGSDPRKPLQRPHWGVLKGPELSFLVLPVDPWAATLLGSRASKDKALTAP